MKTGHNYLASVGRTLGWCFLRNALGKRPAVNSGLPIEQRMVYPNKSSSTVLVLMNWKLKWSSWFLSSRCPTLRYNLTPPLVAVYWWVMKVLKPSPACWISFSPIPKGRKGFRWSGVSQLHPPYGNSTGLLGRGGGSTGIWTFGSRRIITLRPSLNL